MKRGLTRGKGAWFQEGQAAERCDQGEGGFIKASRRPSQIYIASPSTLDPTGLIRSSTYFAHFPFSPSTLYARYVILVLSTRMMHSAHPLLTASSRGMRVRLGLWPAHRSRPPPSPPPSSRLR